MQVYTDADFGTDAEARKSVSGMVTLWEQHPLSWSSKQQTTVTTSTTEAEFVVAAMAAKHGL